MSSDSPVSILFNTLGIEVNSFDGYALSTNTTGFISASIDSSNNIHFLRSDTSGRLIVTGAGTAGTPTSGVFSIQGIASGTAVGISAGSLPLPTGAAADTTLSKLTIAQSSALGSNTLAMVGGSVTTSAPSYTAGNINPLSLTTSGALRTDGYTRIYDGINSVSIKGSGTSPTSLDPSFVVTNSPNSPDTIISSASGTMSSISSTVTLNIKGATACAYNIGANLVGTLQFTASLDGVNFFPVNFSYFGGPNTIGASSVAVTGTGGLGSIILPPGVRQIVASLSSYTSGSSTLILQGSQINASVVLTDIFGQSQASILAPSTAPTSSNGSLVVSIRDFATTASLKSASESNTGATTGTIASLTGGAVTTSAPSYTTGQMNPLSLTTTGLLRIDGSGVTQPVSGTVTANIGTTNGLALDVTLTGGTQQSKITDGARTATIKASNIAASNGDSSLVVAVSPNTPVVLSNSGSAVSTLNPLPINIQQVNSGSIPVQIGTGQNFTFSGSGQSNTLVSAGASNAGFSIASGLTATLIPEYTIDGSNWFTSSAQLAGSTSPVSSIILTGSAVVGNFNVPSGSFEIRLRCSSYTSGSALCSLTSGGMDATRITDATGTYAVAVKPASTAAVATDQALVVCISPNSAANVDGYVTTSSPTYTTGTFQPLSLDTTGALRVNVTAGGTGGVSSSSSTATLTNASGAITNVSILALNSSRKGAILQNESTAAMYLAYASTASTSAYTVLIPANTNWEMPSPTYTGALSAVWSSATGFCRISELT